MGEKILLYFDTCVLNKLAYIQNYDYVLEKFKKSNYVICISEVNILEILRDINDKPNIDKIITMLQDANDNLYLLPSISLIVESFIKREEISTENSYMNKLIMEVLNNKDLVFKYDNTNNLNNYKKLYKFIRNSIKEIKKCEGCNEEFCTNRIDIATKLFATILIRYDIFFNENVNLMKEIGINSNKAIVEYINENFNYLIENKMSPFRNMGRMAILQKESNNGTFNDCLHSAYFDFVDYIISDDKHFNLNLRNCLTFGELMKTINIEIEWQNEEL